MIDESNARLLSQSTLFSGLSADSVVPLLERVPSVERGFEGGILLAQRGDPWDSLWILLEGQVKAEIHDPSGKNLQIETLRVPDALAPAIPFSSEPFLPVSLRAEVAGRALILPRGSVLRLMQSEPVFLANYLRELGDKVNFLADKVRFFRFSTLKEKVARFLLDQQSRRNTSRFRLPYSLEALADLFGVARPSLSRVLGDMDREGIIRRDKGVFEILEPDGLQRLFSE